MNHSDCTVSLGTGRDGTGDLRTDPGIPHPLDITILSSQSLEEVLPRIPGYR
jgi:hypothetical protein